MFQIHDGGGTFSQFIGRFCGKKLPNNGTIQSSHNSIFLRFVTDGDVEGDGFEFSWVTKEPSCGGVIDLTTHGTLNSPGSPGNYPPNRDCYWLIFGPSNKRIQFHFYIMMLGDNPDCNADYLEVRLLPSLSPSFSRD